MKRLLTLQTLVTVLMLMTLSWIGLGKAYGQENAGGLSFGLSIGQDNAYLCQGGKCFLAIGGGFDVLGYEKPLGTKGSVLDLKLHGMALAKVTNNESGQLYGAAITLDVIRLITGAQLSVLVDDLRLLIGPAVAHDVTSGRVAYGGMINFNYKF